ncbi:MAG: hypothetical protein LUG99_09190 [Lachnospiraceae bacterium]|nr:hypothetical protein [Lachnospiraceae bacterium]
MKEYEGYIRLANAIIVKAVKDYKSQLRVLYRNPKAKGAAEEAKRIERFFHSGWYSELTTVDADYLIRKVKEQVEEEMKRKAEKEERKLKRQIEAEIEKAKSSGEL